MILQVWEHLGRTGIFFRNAKLCLGSQEQHTSRTNARDTTALNIFRLPKVESCVSSLANPGWVAARCSTNPLTLGNRAKQAMRDWAGVRGHRQHQARGSPIGSEGTNR